MNNVELYSALIAIASSPAMVVCLFIVASLQPQAVIQHHFQRQSRLVKRLPTSLAVAFTAVPATDVSSQHQGFPSTIVFDFRGRHHWIDQPFHSLVHTAVVAFVASKISAGTSAIDFFFLSPYMHMYWFSFLFSLSLMPASGGHCIILSWWQSSKSKSKCVCM